MSAIDAIFFIAILIMSIVVHEVAHGFMALRLGDQTARYSGRLTLNPIKHLDLFGSILVPLFLYLSQVGIIFGWAKPVPYNPDNLRNKRWGTLAVASAGVLANFAMAIIFGLVLRFSIGFELGPAFYSIVSNIVIINLVLALFNLIPVPPFDGSKILFSILPQSYLYILREMERYALFIMLIIIFVFGQWIFPAIYQAFSVLFQAITGLGL